MEGVERNSDGKKNIEMGWLIGNATAGQGPLEVFEQKVSVLKKPEHAQVHGHADDEPDFARAGPFLFRHLSAEIKIHGRRPEKKGGEGRIPRAVEDVARDQEQILAPVP